MAASMGSMMDKMRAVADEKTEDEKNLEGLKRFGLHGWEDQLHAKEPEKYRSKDQIDKDIADQIDKKEEEEYQERKRQKEAAKRRSK